MALTIKKILVPIDFSEASASALSYGASLASAYQASLVVGTVADDDSNWVVDLSDRVHVKDRWRDERLAEGLRLIDEFCKPILGGLPFERSVRIGVPDDEIVAWCGDERADMLVIGAHGTRGVVSDWLGGVAYAVSKKAPCPVLMVRPRSADEPESRG